MSDTRPMGRVEAAKVLWRRAPLWRLMVYCSALSLLLVLLFPPQWKSAAAIPAPRAINAARYAPPADVAAAGRAPATGPALSLATPGGPSAGISAAGIDGALIGRTYHDEMVTNGFHVPLPPGEWAVLATSNIFVKSNPQNAGTTYFIGKIEKGRLVGALQINALRTPAAAPTGFDEFKACSNPDNLFTNKEAVAPFDHQACWVIHSFFTPPWLQWGDKGFPMENLMRAAAGDLAAKGVTYPQDLVAVQFIRSEKWGVLNATYLFSPEQDGIQSTVVPTFRDADWFASNVQRFPEKLAYVEKLRKWGDVFWPRFKAAFDAGKQS